jgi:hypothetical protein
MRVGNEISTKLSKEVRDAYMEVICKKQRTFGCGYLQRYQNKPNKKLKDIIAGFVCFIVIFIFLYLFTKGFTEQLDIKGLGKGVFSLLIFLIWGFVIIFWGIVGLNINLELIKSDYDRKEDLEKLPDDMIVFLFHDLKNKKSGDDEEALFERVYVSIVSIIIIGFITYIAHILGLTRDLF